MTFFDIQDFDSYSSVIGEVYISDTPRAKELKTILTKNGVFDKTKYWGNLLKEKGYSIESQNRWQDFLRVRSYTWAKIYVPGKEKSEIYFTIGVGSRTENNSKILSLIIKLDCQRKKGSLTQYQISIFDKYLNDNFPNKDYIEHIYKFELKNYNWETLTEKTQDFIEKFKSYYNNIIDLLWPNGIGILPKVARLCWNDLDWEKPSGPDGKSDNQEYTFESKGYGHEEWLFDLQRNINGYHYGFVQAFNKGKHHGNTYDLHLYTSKFKNNSNSWFWVGRIKKAEVLTSQEQKKVFEIYKYNGWYQEMMQELNDVDVKNRDLEIVSEEELFNVKFKIDFDSFIKFDKLKKIDNPKQKIGPGYGRYGLKDLFTNTASIENSTNQYKFISGHKKTKTGKTKSVYTKKTIDRTLKHKEIQEYMYHQLVKENNEDSVGTEVPTGYGTSIDLVVVQPDKSEWFYEVKTYNQPLVCIREAFGQILEYAMFSKHNHAKKLIIVGINEPNKSELEYLNHLRLTTSLNIYYQVFDLANKKLVSEFY